MIVTAMKTVTQQLHSQLSSCDTQNCNHRVVTFTLARATEAGEDNMAKCSGVKDFPVATAYENAGWGKNPDDKCNPPAPEFLFHNAEVQFLDAPQSSLTSLPRCRAELSAPSDAWHHERQGQVHQERESVPQGGARLHEGQVGRCFLGAC